MQEIISIPFWIVYLASHAEIFLSFVTFVIAAIMIIATVIASVIYCNDASDSERAFARSCLKSHWVTFPLFLLFGLLASAAPSKDDFKAYVIVKCCNEALHSDIGKSSQEAITGWLTKQIEENYKSLDK